MKPRLTKQKHLLEEAIGKYRSFFNAEEVHQKVSERNPKIGLATIYRYLNDQVNVGKLHSYTCNRRTLYSTSKKNHCHFHCERCGEIKHIQLQRLDFLKQDIEGDICHFQIDVKGICRECILMD
ncbi:MAG: transcriptional repressor [Nanoarchaeota archaeon]|nr:transcriptional repressor [Nanoarchaeota archaeon]